MAQPALRERVFHDFQPCSSHRDAALVRLPPRFTELHGLRSALTLREHVQPQRRSRVRYSVHRGLISDVIRQRRCASMRQLMTGPANIVTRGKANAIIGLFAQFAAARLWQFSARSSKCRNTHGRTLFTAMKNASALSCRRVLQI
jgi:hypothetical protein